MKELKFYGASDDLFECEGAIREEICMYSNPGVYHLKSSEGEMLIIACYTDEGCWAIGVGQAMKKPLFLHGLHHIASMSAAIALFWRYRYLTTPS
ncbi:hypothetical protein [Klebsiella pneumoniae]|uniref:hypothetical protein n=1 Tax=Klebsiella pneumoniae TaxID=573 RepID=UPI0020A63935|nr:hypothetical protein [Klebsiella pneumoniae]